MSDIPSQRPERSQADFSLKMAAPGMTVLVFQLVSGVNLTRAVVALGSFQILNVCGLGFQNLRC